jgi:triacylglycerol lipase
MTSHLLNRLRWLLLLACLDGTTCIAQNQEPIVLVHGIAGWGREESPLLYWGGGSPGTDGDIEHMLISQGFNVHTAAVGPYSSNWDRAVELYYQIAGGCVDYGLKHKYENHHDRYDNAKCYPGFYKEWGTNHKIHLIAHSQGGQTVRLLAALLQQGNPEQLDKDSDLKNLFHGGRENWIHSITTISTPHNGSTLADMQKLIPELSLTLAAFRQFSNLDVFSENYLKLGQWPHNLESGLTLSSYLTKVFANGPHDFSVYDLSKEGAQELNQHDALNQNIHYFSIATQATTYHGFNWLGLGVDCWNEAMQPILRPLSELINLCPAPAFLGAQEWLANDGVINTISMKAPAGQPSQDFSYDQPSRPGVWQYLGVKAGWDHLHVVGMDFELSPRWSHFEVNAFYFNHAKFLSGL